MNEVGAEIVKTEETKESGVKYLNINVSNSEISGGTIHYALA